MLRYAFFPDFKSSPTLLFWGRKADMITFSDFLRRTARTPRNVIRLSEAGFYAPTGDTVIVIPKKGLAGGVRRLDAEEGTFRWELDVSHAEQFAEMVDVLAVSSQPGHQYLEHSGMVEVITVMVSCDEYPDDLISGKASP
jgi:hypothetical protein